MQTKGWFVAFLVTSKDPSGQVARWAVCSARGHLSKQASHVEYVSKSALDHIPEAACLPAPPSLKGAFFPSPDEVLVKGPNLVFFYMVTWHSTKFD